jgi:hypothetical protein
VAAALPSASVGWWGFLSAAVPARPLQCSPCGLRSLRCRAFDFLHFAPQSTSGIIRSGTRSVKPVPCLYFIFLLQAPADSIDWIACRVAALGFGMHRTGQVGVSNMPASGRSFHLSLFRRLTHNAALWVLALASPQLYARRVYIIGIMQTTLQAIW